MRQFPRKIGSGENTGGAESAVENQGRHRPRSRTVGRPPGRRDQGATDMGHPAAQVSSTAPAEPVPVAFLGRTSTLLLQDPAASLRRQAREVQAKLPPAGSAARGSGTSSLA